MTVTPTATQQTFYSTNSKVDDWLLPVGSVVDAYDIDNTHIGTATVVIPGAFNMVVYGDDGGGVGPGAGETVLFYIDSVLVETVQGMVAFSAGSNTEITLLVWVATEETEAPVAVTVHGWQEGASALKCPICNLLLARDATVWRNHMENVHAADNTTWAGGTHSGETSGIRDTLNEECKFGYICYCCKPEAEFASRTALKSHLGSYHGCMV